MISYYKAKVDEASEIKKLLYKTWTSTYSDIYSLEAIQTVTSDWHSIKLLTKQILNPNISFIVAKENEKIIGMCNAIFKPKSNSLNIQRLHVDPDYQRQGIGSTLIKKVISAFPKASKVHLEVEKQNLRAIAFYQKHGYQEVKKKVFVIKNVQMPCIIMEKSIYIRT